MRYALAICAVLVAFAGGGVLDAYHAGSLLPVRDAGGACAAVDQDASGRIVGKWTPRGGRCELRDWRMWHPFQG